MSTLMIKDLHESKSMDRAAMSGVRGGLTIGAITYQADQSQTIGGPASQHLGDINAVNAPTFSPVTNIVEASPLTYTDIDVANLSNVLSSGVSL